MRAARRALIERAESADLVRRALDAGFPMTLDAWRRWRDLRNGTSHAPAKGGMMHAASMSCSSGIILSPEQAQTVRDILKGVLLRPSGDHDLQAWIFGSRATGHARPFSDLDILIDAPHALDWRALTRVDISLFGGGWTRLKPQLSP